MYPLCKKDIDSSCTLLCESGDRVMVDQSSFIADLRAVMLRHHCSEYAISQALDSGSDASPRSRRKRIPKNWRS